MKDSVEIARKANKPLHILGSNRLSLKWKRNGKHQPYFYTGKDLSFHGMIGGEEKNAVLRNSQALIFPVLIHEAFGLAMIESLYLGCPVIGSHHGSVPELIIPEVDLSTSSKTQMIEALKNIDQFSRKACHEYARDQFNHLVMSKEYISYYEQVLNGYPLHEQPPYCSGHLDNALSLEE
nr:glycosyltransferase [Acinetobacter indicus]